MTSLLITEVFPPLVGGSGRFFWEIYRRLPRQDYIIAAGEYPDQEAVDRAHHLRVVRAPLKLSTWGVFSLRGVLGYRRGLKPLWRIVRSERIRMLHCARPLQEGLMGWWIHRWTGIPYFSYVWGEEVNHATSSRELTCLTRRVLHRAAFLITCSRNTERLLVEQWQVPAGRIRLLPPGVDVHRFVPAARDPAARAALGWHGRPVVLSVSRLDKRKGNDQMILALHAVRKAVPDVLFAVVGDGEEEQPLREMVRREGLEAHVQFLGSIGMDDPRLIQCYQQCDLFALPNRQVGKDIEGFGMVLIEAQACGKPVIGGTSGGTADTMSVPETGLLINCEGPDQLAAAVTELLTDHARRERMGRAARAWVLDNFDWDVLARKAEQIFHDAGKPATVPLRAELAHR
jgi:phosphatidylinositol alpha-1,6-mannosyltransferase